MGSWSNEEQAGSDNIHRSSIRQLFMEMTSRTHSKRKDSTEEIEQALLPELQPKVANDTSMPVESAVPSPLALFTPTMNEIVSVTVRLFYDHDYSVFLTVQATVNNDSCFLIDFFFFLGLRDAMFIQIIFNVNLVTTIVILMVSALNMCSYLPCTLS